MWTPPEVRALAGDANAEIFNRVYDVTDGGNWNDPHGHEFRLAFSHGVLHLDAEGLRPTA